MGSSPGAQAFVQPFPEAPTWRHDRRTAASRVGSFPHRRGDRPKTPKISAKVRPRPSTILRITAGRQPDHPSCYFAGVVLLLC